MPELMEIAKQNKAWACYDCGKCTATCPLTRAGAEYSPRKQVLATNQGYEDIVKNGTLFECLTCSLCDQRCPAEVAYTDMVKDLRHLAYKEGTEPECPHGGALQSVMRMMASGGTQQDRMGWVTDDLRIDTAKGKVFYFTGCTMYYDTFFTEFGVKTLDGTRAAVRLMNELGIKPVVSPAERCCGHDLLWNGDRASFESLARHNVKMVKDSGAEILVTSCAECLRTWKVDYEPFMEGKPPKIVHITELLGERIGELKLKKNGTTRVTFQDACRMGRHLGIYDSPRKTMEAIPGLELVEMGRSGSQATCCAGGTWSNCDRFAKQIQVNRLKEAKATGAETLVTACPKCQVHFKCAMKDPRIGEEIKIEMRDVAELLADALN